MKCKKLCGLRLGLVGICLYFCSSIATAVEPVAPQNTASLVQILGPFGVVCTRDRIRYELSKIKKTVSQMGSKFCNPWGFAGNRVNDKLKCHTVAAQIANELINTVQPCCVYITMMQALKIPFGLRSHTLVGVFAPPYRGGVSPSSRDWLLSIEGWGTSCPPKITMGEAFGFDGEVLFSDPEVLIPLTPLYPTAQYCTDAVKITATPPTSQNWINDSPQQGSSAWNMGSHCGQGDGNRELVRDILENYWSYTPKYETCADCCAGETFEDGTKLASTEILQCAYRCMSRCGEIHRSSSDVRGKKCKMSPEYPWGRYWYDIPVEESEAGDF